MQYDPSKLTGGLRRLWRQVVQALRSGRRASTSSQPAAPYSGILPRAAGRFRRPPSLALALQGGGAHGAFTWGVLDRLLEEDGLPIVAISGASAGAINGAALAAGYLDGGNAGARERLEALWRKLVELARFSPLGQTPFERFLLGRNSEWSFSHVTFDLVSRLYSPYQLNPLGLRPFRELLAALIDFERLRSADAIPLLVAATNVETGAARIFGNAELSPEVLLASACLPTLYPAVKLDDGHYWDGGFTANPPLLPLIEVREAAEILLVRTIPQQRAALPTSARAIQSRLSGIIFDGALKRELESIAWLRRMAGKDGAAARRLASLRLHVIGGDAVLSKLSNASKFNPDWPLVDSLKDAGRAAAERWLAAAAAPRPAANDEDAGGAGHVPGIAV